MSIKITYTQGLFPGAPEFSELREKVGVVICPNPMMADGVRRLLEANAVADFDVLTVSKATAELSAKLDVAGTPLRKSKILMHFATLWKSVHGTTSFEMFIQSYQLFSEFRSFTTDYNLVTEALGALSQEQQAALALYWRYLEQSSILDEHSLYEEISKSCLLVDDPAQAPVWKNIVFWGFPHLSGTQVNLIKSLAHITHVNIFFPREMLAHVHAHDYVAWLDADFESQMEVDPLPAESKKIPCLNFAKKRLAEVLSENFESSHLRGQEILLGSRRAHYHLMQEIPFAPTSFKTQSDAMESIANGIIKELRTYSSEGHSSALEYENYLSELIAVATERQDFRRLRALMQYQLLFREYVELSSLNEEIEQFDLKLFAEIFPSALPRMFTSSLVENERTAIGLNALDSLAAESSENIALLIASTQYGPLKSREVYYPDEVAEFLAVVGPLKRSEFEFQLLKLRLQTLIRKNDLTLVIEGELAHEDPAWSDVLAPFELVSLAPKEILKEKKLRDFVVRPLGRYERVISASSLQLYLDCPRKFYVSKMAKLDERRDLSIDLAPSEMGTLEHALIGELYFLKRDERLIRERIKARVMSYLEESNKAISKLLLKSSLVEIEEALTNGLTFLDQIGHELRIKSIEFDVRLNDRSGEADCLLRWDEEGGERWGVLDFKRSRASVATKSEIADFKKIQLPFYIHHLGLKLEECGLMGYVNLSSLEDSVLMRLNSNFTSELPVADLGGDPNEYLQLSQEFLEQLEEKLRADETFKPRPLNTTVCTYCAIRNICLKSEGDL